MSKAYEDEQKMLKGKLASITEQLRCYEEKQDNATHFIALIRAYTDIKELDAAMLNALIEKIVVHEREYIDGERIQKLRFITACGADHSLTPLRFAISVIPPILDNT